MNVMCVLVLHEQVNVYKSWSRSACNTLQQSVLGHYTVSLANIGSSIWIHCCRVCSTYATSAKDLVGG